MSRESLNKLFNSLGDIALNLTDQFSEGWHFPISEEDADKIRARWGEVFDLTSIKKGINGIIYFGIEISTRKKEEGISKNEQLAYRLFNHDIFTLAALAKQLAEGPSIIPERLDDIGYINRAFNRYTNLRLFALGAAYLATEGDSRFSANLPASQIKSLIQYTTRRSFEFTIERDDLINCAVYTVFYQVMKNSQWDIQCRYQRDENGGMLHYQDGATGILDQDGKPISKDKLPSIFGEFSTRKRGGLGLQVTKALIDLLGGSIQVISSNEGRAPIKYDTKTGVIETLAQDKHTGTQFKLYFP